MYTRTHIQQRYECNERQRGAIVRKQIAENGHTRTMSVCVCVRMHFSGSGMCIAVAQTHTAYGHFVSISSVLLR